MYKNLIIGGALIAIIISGYYITKSGGTELITNAYNNDPSVSYEAPTVETVTGIYACDKKSGCKNKYVLLLKEDQTVEMLSKPPSEDDTTDKITEEETATSTDTGPTTEERNSIVENTDIPDTSSVPTSLNNDVPTSDNSTATTSSDQVASTTDSVGVTTDESSSDNSLKGKVFEDINETPSSTLKGKWDFGVGNILILTLTEQGTTTFDVPHKFIINKVGSSVLSSITYNKLDYSDMVKPTFVKQN